MTDEEKRSDEAQEAKKSEETADGGTSETKAEATEAKDDSASQAAGQQDGSLDDTIADEPKIAAAPNKEHDDEPKIAAAPNKEHDDDAHDDDEHDDDEHDDDHGAHSHSHGGDDHSEHLGHTAPVSLLVGVLVALGMLTILTVAVTAVDLGSQGNFVVAMIIATVKAILVMGYFMHMFWDSRFNVVAFTSSFLFVLLFLAMTVLDGSEYQKDVKDYQNDKKALM